MHSLVGNMLSVHKGQKIILDRFCFCASPNNVENTPELRNDKVPQPFDIKVILLLSLFLDAQIIKFCQDMKRRRHSLL
jgi:hypothetical protein